MRPGTLPWLLRHELRLSWRDLTGNRSTLWFIGVGLAILVGLHILFWNLLRPYRTGGFELDLLSPPFVLIGTLLWFVGLTLALTQAMHLAVSSLFERADLDLLVSSPVSTRVIFAARTLGVVIGIVLTFAIFLVPVMNIGLMAGIPQAWGVLPSLVALALTAASLGMLLTLLLVRLFGARRARTIAQIVGSLIGASLFLLSQLPNFMGRERLERFTAWLVPRLPTTAEELESISRYLLPGRALFLDPTALAVMLGLGLLLFALTVNTLHRSFIAGTQASVNIKRPVRQGGTVRFSGSLTRVMIVKEWRLILRDPYLISHTLLQILYFIPLVFLMLQGNEGGLTNNAAVGGIGVLLGGMLATSLAKICVAGEDAPELLAASPIPMERLRRLKLVAALLPVWVMLVPLYLVLGVRGGLPIWVGLLSFIAATSAVGIIRLWNPMQLKRQDIIKNRSGSGNDLLSILEMLTLFAWAAVAFGIMNGAWWAFLGLGLGLLFPVLAYLRTGVSAAAV